MSHESAELWTVAKLLGWTENFLRQKGVESPRLDAQILLAHVLNCPKIQLYVNSDQPTTDEERAAFRGLIKRRVEGEPVSRLVGYREFYSLRFRVTPDVLDPRSETELLVVEALGFLKGRQSARVLDLGTGSGCIAVTIGHQNSKANVTAVDLSAAALDVAKANAGDHGVADRVRFLEGDLFSPLETGERFDLVVSNPPYIAEGEFAELSREVKDHDPRLALDGGADGLAVLRRIAEGAPKWLGPGGRLMVEIGHRQGDTVRELLAANGFIDVRVIKDDSGHSRVVVGRTTV